jgi:adenylate cyclase
VSFTKIAEKLTPEELVKEIDTYFREFDAIMARYGVEKIKTIGDAYMAAGGLSNDNTTAAFDVTNAAFDVLKIVEDLKNEREALKRPAFQIRVGINTGPVVAGVVGSTKFQYDIWGDAVNTAARMEQNSEPGKINVSQSTYDLIKDTYTCTSRGLKEAKNKGQINMYFVEKS